MEIIKYDIQKKIVKPSYLLDNESFCFLDIETTGLSRNYHQIVLIGIFIVKDGTQQIVQLFAETLNDEKKVLQSLVSILTGVNTIFTFNGSSFDIPFIKTKLDKHGISFNMASLTHVDLIKNIRKNKEQLGLPNCKLKTVEKKLGIKRKDTIDGGESVLLYMEFLKTKNPSIKKTILRHNYEDIYYLSDVLALEQLDDNKLYINLGTKGNIKKISVPFQNIRLKKGNLLIKGFTPSIDGNSIFLYEDFYELSWDFDDGFFDLTIYLDSFDKNNSDFLYLNLSNPLLIDIAGENGIILFEDKLVISENKDLIYENIIFIIKNILNKWL